MLFRMIRGVLFHQKGKMLLIALTIALGASLATGMLNVVLGVEEKVNKELKNYGANIVVKPKDSSLLSDIYDVGEGGELNTAYLREDELGKLKTIFWAFNIVDFTPFLDASVTLPDASSMARPAVRSTAFVISAQLILSSMMISQPTESACSSSPRLRTSTSIFVMCPIFCRSAVTAGTMPP